MMGWGPRGPHQSVYNRTTNFGVAGSVAKAPFATRDSNANGRV